MSAFESENVLTIKTVQIGPMRTLMTALKDILLETNITFKKDGIRIINMDKSHTMLAHLFLAAENFEHYECKEEKIVIGVNMFHLFKLINTIDKKNGCKFLCSRHYHTRFLVENEILFYCNCLLGNRCNYCILGFLKF